MLPNRSLVPTLLAGLLLLAGCATPPPKPVSRYVPPTDGPTARLVMRGTLPAGDLYGVYLLADTERCGDRRLVGAGSAKGHPATTTLAAGQMQTVEFLMLKPNKQVCAVRWSFSPVAGKTYLLRGAGHSAGCIAAVMDMTDPESIKVEPSALRRNPAGTACVPLAQSKTVAVPGAGADAPGQEAVLRQGAGADELQGLISP